MIAHRISPHTYGRIFEEWIHDPMTIDFVEYYQTLYKIKNMIFVDHRPIFMFESQADLTEFLLKMP